MQGGGKMWMEVRAVSLIFTSALVRCNSVCNSPRLSVTSAVRQSACYTRVVL